jgi:prepilin-type processing-associated H-X9-DG protein
VGLWWSQYVNPKELASDRNLFQKASSTNSPPGSRAVKPEPPAFRVGMIRAPSRTLLLTEEANSKNLLGGYVGAAIRSAHEQLDTGAISMENYHQGRFNYLMVDGHVEDLFPAQSEGKEDVANIKVDRHVGNIWTVRPND